MISKKTARKNVQHYNSIVFSKVNDIGELVKRHSEIGSEDMEVFIEASKYNVLKESLERKGYYVSSAKFESMPECLIMYVSWNMSNM